jgi:hypothetical protein
VLGAILLLVGCAAAPHRRPGADDLRRLQQNTDEPVYYPGLIFDGLRLTDALDQGEHRSLLVYGTCTPEPDSGCAPPIEIQLFPFRASAWRLAVGCQRLTSVRGVPTVRHDGLVLATGHQVVKIYGRGPGEERHVARALRRIDGQPTPQHLPPPPERIRSLIGRVCSP